MLQSVGHFGKLIYNGFPISCDDTFLSKKIKMNDKFVLVPQSTYIRVKSIPENIF